MPSITSVTGRQILDSRGRPTVEATVLLSDGTAASSSVPSGAISNEKFEAYELRDQDPTQYFGLGVQKAVELINTEINQKLAGLDPLYQTTVDQTLVDLDGTKNKSRLGGNTILAVSQAVAKVAAASLRLPLFVYIKEKYQLISAYRIPTPIFNLINGGRHGAGTLDFQEFQLVPASHLPYSQALKIGAEMFMSIENILEQKGALTTVGLEGGFSPNLANNTDALEIFQEAAKQTQYALSKDAFLGIDIGPTNFHKNGKFTIKDRSQPMGTKDFIKYLKQLHEQYRVFSFEDPLLPDDWNNWKTLTAEIGQTAMIMADDLIVTNKTLLKKAIEEKACNSLVIKPNRAGTITETVEIVSIAKKAGWHTIMSHRSSETTDDVLADVAVGVGTDYVKFGATSRGERVVKYNRLLRIEEILKTSAQPAKPDQADQSAPTNHPAPQPVQPAQMNEVVAPPQQTQPVQQPQVPEVSVPSTMPTSPTEQPSHTPMTNQVPPQTVTSQAETSLGAPDQSAVNIQNQPSTSPPTQSPVQTEAQSSVQPTAQLVTQQTARPVTERSTNQPLPQPAAQPTSAAEPVLTINQPSTQNLSQPQKQAPLAAQQPSSDQSASTVETVVNEAKSPEETISENSPKTPEEVLPTPAEVFGDLTEEEQEIANQLKAESEVTINEQSSATVGPAKPAQTSTPDINLDNVQDSINELAQIAQQKLQSETTEVKTPGDSAQSGQQAADQPVSTAKTPVSAPAQESVQAQPELSSAPNPSPTTKQALENLTQPTVNEPSLPETNNDSAGLPKPVPPQTTSN